MPTATSTTRDPSGTHGPATRSPDAVLLDCDGTIADTEVLSQRAWTTVLERRGYVPADSDFQAIIGHAWPRSYDHFARRVDLGDPARVREEVRAEARRLHATELALFPDAVDTVLALGAAGIPLAVVSSSARAHVLRCLEVGGLTDHVAVVVGADDVAVHKPDPTPYLLGASRLGVDPRRCTTVEDTATGLASARAAGTFVVAVARGAVDPATLADADRVVHELTVDAVRPPPTGPS